MFSAVKVGGKKLYELARQGVEIEREAREIEVTKLEITRLELPDVDFTVACSKGTYVRTLGADIAKKLDTFGHLTALRRTNCAKFDLSNTILLESLKNMSYIGERQSQLLPLLTSLCDITVIAVREEDATKLRMGQKISPKTYTIANIIGQDVIATCNNEAVALVRIEETRISPIRVFNLK
jgi:tRNA pseudouridine55 synthase